MKTASKTIGISIVVLAIAIASYQFAGKDIRARWHEFVGFDHLESGRHSEAITQFTEAIRLDAESHVAFLERGNAYYDKGEYEKAIEDYSKVISINPEDTDAYFNRGTAYYDKSEYSKAIEDYDKALAIDPDYADAYYNRGYAYYWVGRYDKAIADYSEYIILNPNDADAYIGRGEAHAANHRNFDSGLENYDKAIADYNKAISLDPDNALAYYKRGSAYYYKDEFNRAIADYDIAISFVPHYQLALDGRRRAYEQVEQYEQAIADYDKAIAIQPESAYLIYGRGLVHLKLGNDAAARQDFLSALDMGFDKALIESALTSEPISAKYRSHSPEAHQQGIFHHTRALGRLQQADYDNAVADIDKARELIDPQLIHLYTDEMHQVYFQSGVAYYDTGLYDDAIRLFDKAMDVVVSPSDYPAAYYQRGMSHYRKGNYRRTIADFDMLAGLEQGYPNATHYRQLAQEELLE